ncbi:MAG: hypothetical protein WEB60_08855 [Terrimicrobiaceae bacterium]
MTNHDPHGINGSPSESQRLSLRWVMAGFFLFCLIGSVEHGMAQRPVPTSPPPMAEPAEVRVYRGQQVEIALRAGGRVPGPLRYLIRSQPSRGSLGEPKVMDKNTATITYTHDPKSPAGADSFRFAVQAVDSPVSAPAEILISVQDPPAKLQGLPSLAFGEVAAGSHTRKVIEVANTGGTSTTVIPTVNPPWELEDPVKQIVAPGATQRWTLVFSPTTSGSYSGEFRVPGTPPLVTTLSGQAVELFSVSPDGPLALQNSTRRKASVLVKNRTGDQLTLRVAAPKGILANSLVEIPARGETSLEVQTDPSVLERVSGSLVLEFRDFKKVIPVTSEPAPAILRAKPAGGFQISPHPSSQQHSEKLIVENHGGSPASLKAELPEGLVIFPDPASVIIAPGKAQLFRVSMEMTTLLTDQEPVIEIMAEGANALSIPIKIQKAPIIDELPAPRAQIPMPTNVLPPIPGLEEPPPDDINEIPAISEIRMISKRPGVVQVAWTPPSPLAKSFVIEYRTLEYVSDEAPPLSRWSKFPYVRFQESDDEVIATLSRLPADSAWFIRAVSLDASGKRSLPSEAVRIASPPHPPRPWLVISFVGLVVAGLASLVIRKRLRTHQARQSEEAARISRLEGE